MSSKTGGFDALFIGPHPDDVDLFCGGTVAVLAAAGHRVAIVDLSAGELASNGTPAERRTEAERAAAVLGVGTRRCLGLPDGSIEPYRHADALVAVIRQLRPQLIFAPADKDRHPDHEAAHALVKRATFLAGLPRHIPAGDAPFRPTRTLWYPMHTHQVPDLCVPTETTFATKQRALDCFTSQLARTDSGADTAINRGDYRRELETRDRFFGAQVGFSTAEPYLIDGAIVTDDPVSMFSKHKVSPWQLPRRA